MSLYGVYTSLAIRHKKRRLKNNPEVINENYKPFISIMIPAHNEESVIVNTVENIRQSDYPNYEIILIDDRSDDNTFAVIKNLADKYENVKCMKRELDAFPGKSAVLNDALALAGGEAILVFDADATIDSDFI